MITVILSAALLCYQGACYPALVGEETPTGTYQYYKVEVEDDLYKGSVGVFAKDSTGAYFAIHTIWEGKPEERRKLRIKSPASTERVITNGCINIEQFVYDMLPGTSTLVINP